MIDMLDMIDLQTDLYAVPVNDWQRVPIEANHHKWWLNWYRIEDDGNFCFVFVSPKKRTYTFFTSRDENGARVTIACVARANGATIASYYESWGDSPARLDAVLRLTPKHIIDRLLVLLDAIG